MQSFKQRVYFLAPVPWGEGGERSGAGRRRRAAAARCAEGAAEGRVRTAGGVRARRIPDGALDRRRRAQEARRFRRRQWLQHRRRPRRRYGLSRQEPVLSRLYARARAGHRLHRHQGCERGQASVSTTEVLPLTATLRLSPARLVWHFYVDVEIDITDASLRGPMIAAGVPSSRPAALCC